MSEQGQTPTVEELIDKLPWALDEIKRRAEAGDTVAECVATCLWALKKYADEAHYANGVADLAMKHRNAAEAALAALQAQHEKMREALEEMSEEGNALAGNPNRRTADRGDFLLAWHARLVDALSPPEQP